jgi:predicted esterase
MLPYAVLGAPGSHGPILIEAYGAADQPTHAMVALPVERLWIEHEGRLVVATVRGDARDPPWASDPPDDHGVRAGEDVDDVVADLVARGDAAPGQVTALGASDGAITVARAVLLRPDLFSAAVLAAGPFDLGRDIRWGGRVTGGFAQWYAGSRPSDGACAAVRFFLYLGGQDDRVGPENAAEFASYLASLGYHGGGAVFPALSHHLLEAPTTGPAIISDLDKWAAQRAACSVAR